MFSSYETLTNNHMLMMLVSVMCTKFNGKKVSKKQCKKNMGTTSRPKIRRRCDKKLCKLRIFYYLYHHIFILLITSYFKELHSNCFDIQKHSVKH